VPNQREKISMAKQVAFVDSLYATATNKCQAESICRGNWAGQLPEFAFKGNVDWPVFLAFFQNQPRVRLLTGARGFQMYRLFDQNNPPSQAPFGEGEHCKSLQTNHFKAARRC